MHTRALLALLFTILTWGVAPVYIRAFSLAAGPADALVIRYVLVGILCLVFLPFFGGFRIPQQDWPRLLLISLVGMLGYNLGSVFGFVHVTAGVGGLIIATQPLLIALLAALFGTERLSLAVVAGIAISFIGTGLLFRGDVGSGSGRGELLLGGSLIFLSGLAWSLYVVLSKPLIQRHGAFKITAISILIATVPMLTLASGTTLKTAMNLDAGGLFALFYMVVPSTFMTVATWNYAVGHLKPSAVGATLYLIPLLAVASGAVLLGETVTATTVIAGAIILCGVALAQFGPRMRRTQFERQAD
ncbi:MAG TPA: EamA family transporter [Aestuariivirga sp.]|nr:EamA family transporter [Aestuariivirga sp.]